MPSTASTDGAAPIKKTPNRLLKSYMQGAGQHVKEMAEDDLIELSRSPWRAPIVKTRKRDGSFRFCTYFCRLNSVTVTQTHPLPRLAAAIDQLSGSTFFSCLDLSLRHWQAESARRIERRLPCYLTGNPGNIKSWLWDRRMHLRRSLG